MAANTDQHDRLVEAVGTAFAQRLPLQIVGSGSKVFLTEPEMSRSRVNARRLLSVAEHSGVTEYRPEELVITARAGTTLKELERQLARERQMLPFEPPRFSGAGTLGGAIASGLSGPGRPWYGSLRDALLGTYEADHLVTVLYSSGDPDYESLSRRVALSELAAVAVPVYSNLWVPGEGGVE